MNEIFADVKVYFSLEKI